jgi:UDP-MurNAc hydroxylase
MQTQLRFLGHNCFLIYNDETFLLIDPWLSNKGAFFGSWFQYPKNHHLRDEIIELSKTKNGYVYFTHEHQDHFDLETLRLLSSDTTVIIPAYKDRFLSETIQENGFSCIELPENSFVSIGTQISINIFISEVGINRDSAIFVATGEFTFFNQNDCKIFDRLNEIKERVTYYTVQFSGATGHPVLYENYSKDEKAEISRRKSNAKLTNVVRAIQILKPKFFIPAAGPAIFPYLDPFLSFGRDNIFIHQDILNDVLNSHNINNVLYPMPGDIINESLIGRKFIPPPTPAELADYRTNTVNFWKTHNFKFSISDLKSAVNDRLDKIWDLDFQCETLIQFSWGDTQAEQFIIDLQKKSIIDEYDLSGRNLYRAGSKIKCNTLIRCCDEETIRTS